MVDDIGQGQDVARQRISDDQSSAGCVAFKNFTGQAFLGDLLYEDIDRERAIDAIAMRYEVTVLDPENSVAYIRTTITWPSCPWRVVSSACSSPPRPVCSNPTAPTSCWATPPYG